MHRSNLLLKRGTVVVLVVLSALFMSGCAEVLGPILSLVNRVISGFNGGGATDTATQQVFGGGGSLVGSGQNYFGNLGTFADLPSTGTTTFDPLQNDFDPSMYTDGTVPELFTDDSALPSSFGDGAMGGEQTDLAGSWEDESGGLPTSGSQGRTEWSVPNPAARPNHTMEQEILPDGRMRIATPRGEVRFFEEDIDDPTVQRALAGIGVDVEPMDPEDAAS